MRTLINLPAILASTMVLTACVTNEPVVTPKQTANNINLDQVKPMTSAPPLPPIKVVVAQPVAKRVAEVDHLAATWLTLINANGEGYNKSKVEQFTSVPMSSKLDYFEGQKSLGSGVQTEVVYDELDKKNVSIIGSMAYQGQPDRYQSFGNEIPPKYCMNGAKFLNDVTLKGWSNTNTFAFGNKQIYQMTNEQGNDLFLNQQRMIPGAGFVEGQSTPDFCMVNFVITAKKK